MNTIRPGTASTLRLADHLRAAVVDDEVVLLDLHRGRYFGLKGRHSTIVIRAMCSNHRETDRDDPEERTLVEPLLRNGILTAAPPNGSARLQALPPPDPSPSGHMPAPDAKIGPLDVVRFLVAVSLAALWLRRRSLDAIATAVQDLMRQGRSGAKADEGALARAVAAFDRLRPLVFTSRDQCLFDSLALAVFLGRQGLVANWVIGVSIRPFKAHAWIQDRSDVLNDVPENVRRFTPILIV